VSYWTPDFIGELARGKYRPRYLLEHIKIPTGVNRPFGSNLRLSSFPVSGHTPIISRPESTFSGGVLSLRDWSCTPLSFNVGVLGEEARGRDVRQLVQRGMGVRLKLGFGDDLSEFQDIALGTVYGLSRMGSGWAIRCKGLEGSLGSRITTAAGEHSLGHDLASTTLNHGGALLKTDDPITVTSTTGFREDDNGTGCIQITADDGSTYYATYTGKTATTFTGITIGDPVGTALFGTVHSATADGNAVSEVMYTKGHPLRIAARGLSSRGGSNVNGPDDIMPESWGLGIPADAIHDRDISHGLQIAQPASGADDWHWVQPAEIDNPQDALATFLNGCGYFLTQHRGRITARPALEPWNSQSGAHTVLVDADIRRLVGYESWDPDSPIEYSRTRILYGDGTTASTSATSDLDHIPARDIKEHTMGGVWSDTSNAAAIVTELMGRLNDWDQRTAEVLTLELHGWRWGALSPGDTVDLQFDALTSRTGLSFRTRFGLVTRCAPSWMGSHTQVEIAVLPSDETVPWRVQA
jgi:hypothetical protein